MPIANLAADIERLRISQVRFHGIRADVNQGVVLVSGTVRRWEDLQEFAQAVACLLGVERVVLDKVQADEAPRRGR